LVVKLRYPPPGNWEKAKCKDVPLSSDYDPFFGIEADADEDLAKSQAVAFCNGDYDGNVCPIRHQCLLFALTNNEKIGVWGGTTEITRKGIRKKFPARRDGKPNPEWKWHQENEILQGLNRKEIEKEVQRELLDAD
jgi:WhiB family redox-sensing transcriptional regulator